MYRFFCLQCSPSSIHFYLKKVCIGLWLYDGEKFMNFPFFGTLFLAKLDTQATFFLPRGLFVLLTSCLHVTKASTKQPGWDAHALSNWQDEIEQLQKFGTGGKHNPEPFSLIYRPYIQFLHSHHKHLLPFSTRSQKSSSSLRRAGDCKSSLYSVSS